MVNLMKRARKLQTILNLRVGAGAAILPSLTSASKEFPAVTRLHLTYARKIYGGHQGARHFWRNCLPRLKYYNPGVSMTVQQTKDQDGPAALTIYFAGRASSSSAAITGSEKVTDSHAPVPDANEKTAVVNVKDLNYQDIWTRLQAATGAQEVKASAEDEAELNRLQEMGVKSEKDRTRIQARRKEKEDQERMLAEARGEVEKLKEL